MNVPTKVSADPLSNIGLETLLLGSVLTKNELVGQAADIVKPDDFSEPFLAELYQRTIADVMAGKSATPVTLFGYYKDSEYLEQLGGASFLANLTADPAIYLVDLVDVMRRIADFARRRRMRDSLMQAAYACDDQDRSIAEIVSFADEALSPGASDDVSDTTAAECLGALLAEVDAPISGVRCSSIKSLDELMGPIRPKQLAIVAGRPGMGKTAAALSYATGAARSGHGVLYVSLEMGGTELAARQAADLCYDGDTRVPYSAIRDRRLRGGWLEQVKSAQRYLSEIPLRVIDTGSLTVGRLDMLVRRNARRMEAQGHKLELVVIDYLQLLSPDSRTRSNYEAVSEVSRRLKGIAKDRDVGIMALAQLSREVERRPDKRPMLSDLRDSGQIEQDADLILFLLREEYYLRKAEPPEGSGDHLEWQDAMRQKQGIIEFILAKRRDGVEGVALGEFHGEYQAVRG